MAAPSARAVSKAHRGGSPLRLWMALGAGSVLAAVLVQVLHFGLCSSLLLGLLLAYLPSYLDGSQYRVTSESGSRFWPSFAHSRVWRWLVRYFPASAEAEYDYAKDAQNGAQFVFAMHPHGMLSIDHSLMFTDAVKFMSQIAPLPRRDLGASVIFLVPGLRELCIWLGVVDASARTAHSVLSVGYSMQLYPGGIQEQIATDSEKPVIVAKGRTGFVKLALQYDAPIVPVYVFGEDRLFTSLSFFSGFRKWLVKALRVGVPLYFGTWWSLGLLPRAQRLHMVLGEPLWPRGVDAELQRRVWEQRRKANEPEVLRRDQELAAKQRAAIQAGDKSGAEKIAAEAKQPGAFFQGRRVPRVVSSEEVEEMHERYIRAMQDLFDRHKGKQAGYENAQLEIRSARS